MMKSLLASVRSLGGLDRVDHAVQLLEDEWRRHGDVPLERLWTEQKRLIESEAGDSVVLLAELVKTDLRCRFTRDRRPTVADYLERFPELQGRRQPRPQPDLRGILPDRGARRQRRRRRVLRPLSPVEGIAGLAAPVPSSLQPRGRIRPKPTPFPEAGDTFEEFQLVSLLGRGGTSRVFLAKDLSLGGSRSSSRSRSIGGASPRPRAHLTIRISSRSTRSSSATRRCADFRCRTARACRSTRSSGGSTPPRSPASAMALWEALVRPTEVTTEAEQKPSEGTSTPEVGAARPKGDGWEGFPVRGTYAQGVAWIVKVVAEALHYAHGQETFHRDVKPANVLLTLQHGPQLLDFNLAESPHSASQAQAAMHGGTLPYMAPEQIEAFLNPDLWGKVGAPADIYSLGLVLRELLTGQAPDLPAETLAPARDARPARPPSVARRLGAAVQSGHPPCPRGDRRQVPGGSAGGPLSRRRCPGRRSRSIPAS